MTSVSDLLGLDLPDLGLDLLDLGLGLLDLGLDLLDLGLGLLDIGLGLLDLVLGLDLELIETCNLGFCSSCPIFTKTLPKCSNGFLSSIQHY